MNRFFNLLRMKIDSPEPIDLLALFVLLFLCGTATGEIVSRPVNSYVQAFCMLLTLYFCIVFLRTVGIWVLNYIHNKTTNK